MSASIPLHLSSFVLLLGLLFSLLFSTAAVGQTVPSTTAAAPGAAADKKADKKPTKKANNPKAKSAPGLAPASNSHVAIPRGALGKEFLLSASIIPQALAPTSRGLSGRIVRFELFHDGVDLYESTTGLVVTKDLPARRLLTTFPIVAQDDKKIVIDFNAGMRRVFTDSWYSGSGFSTRALSTSLELPQSRVFSVKAAGDRLVIRQAAQVRSRSSSQDRESRWEIRYFLRPYTKEKFKAKENTKLDSRYLRYFQSRAELELTSGRAVSRIARFDISKPVVFYYSANTPKDYVEAIKGGILYWNRAFGKPIVEAKPAPKGVTAPSLQHNMVQWVPWDRAGFAYADVLIDPRTGRSQRGQAYMTSTFAIGGERRARVMLRILRVAGEKQEPAKGDAADRLGISFLQPAGGCDVDQALFARQMADGLEVLLAAGKIDDGKFLQASQDYVRNITAHEVGHVLGLRHNFAGSLGANVSPAELDEWFKSYLTGEKPKDMKGRWTTSSVMEYTPFKAAVFNGHKMRTTEEALPHDKAAIQWGYYGSTEARDKKMLFGTDDDTRKYADVVRFDYGVEPLVGAMASISEHLRYLPNNLIETFIAAKAPRDPRDRGPLEAVKLNPDSTAARLAGYYSRILVWFRSKTRSLRIERDFPVVDALSEKALLAAHWKSLNEQVKKLGGIDRVAFSYLPVTLKLDLKVKPKDIVAPEKFDAAKMSQRVAELLESDSYKTFVGADGKTHSFTDEEKALIKKRAKAYFDRYEQALVKRIVTALGGASRDLGVKVTGSVSDDDMVAQFEKQIIALAKVIITAKDDKSRRRGKLGKGLVEVVEYKYDLETRLAAGKMLSDGIGSFSQWSKDAKGAMHKALKDDVDGALNINNLKAFKPSQLSRPLRQWYLDQQKVLGMLPKSS
ncbi:MAG: zinc-dependent metalloprotease [Planctomycetes bacterium]|nr:zinc-dependent metalloprotease [Planctomycetota bacterium]